MVRYGEKQSWAELSEGAMGAPGTPCWPWREALPHLILAPGWLAISELMTLPSAAEMFKSTAACPYFQIARGAFSAPPLLPSSCICSVALGLLCRARTAVKVELFLAVLKLWTVCAASGKITPCGKGLLPFLHPPFRYGEETVLEFMIIRVGSGFNFTEINLECHKFLDITLGSITFICPEANGIC